MISEFVLEPFRKAVRVLESLGIRYVLLGGLAMNVWERIRATRDADFLVAEQEVDIDQLCAAMREAGFSHHEGANRVQLEDIGLLRFWCPAGDTGFSMKTDVLLGRSKYHEVVLGRGLLRETFGHAFAVASVEDCILLKLAAGRPIDNADAVELASIHAGILDRSYLTEWAKRLNVAESLQRILSERQ